MNVIDRLLYFFVRRREAKAALLLEQARVRAQSADVRLILKAMRDGTVIETAKGRSEYGRPE